MLEDDGFGLMAVFNNGGEGGAAIVADDDGVVGLFVDESGLGVAFDGDFNREFVVKTLLFLFANGLRGMFPAGAIDSGLGFFGGLDELAIGRSEKLYDETVAGDVKAAKDHILEVGAEGAFDFVVIGFTVPAAEFGAAHKLQIDRIEEERQVANIFDAEKVIPFGVKDIGRIGFSAGCAVFFKNCLDLSITKQDIFLLFMKGRDF